MLVERRHDISRLEGFSDAVFGFPLMVLMFVLPYSRAHARRHQLGLSELDVFDLKALRGHHVVSASVGSLSLAMALSAPLSLAPFGPAALGLMGPGHALWAVRHNKQRRALASSLDAAQR